jgi:hypothetical protein
MAIFKKKFKINLSNYIAMSLLLLYLEIYHFLDLFIVVLSALTNFPPPPPLKLNGFKLVPQSIAEQILFY